jgi:hypothetical protein
MPSESATIAAMKAFKQVGDQDWSARLGFARGDEHAGGEYRRYHCERQVSEWNPAQKRDDDDVDHGNADPGNRRCGERMPPCAIPVKRATHFHRLRLHSWDLLLCKRPAVDH